MIKTRISRSINKQKYFGREEWNAVDRVSPSRGRINQTTQNFSFMFFVERRVSLRNTPFLRYEKIIFLLDNTVGL